MERCPTPLLFGWLLAAILIAATSADISELVGKPPKTSFSCQGRAPGYYADVETGCTVYHMCDESGRQFTNRCPNATLFQQRMLICDHWYMVKCENSENDYKANLLIGQKDALFVTEEEKFHEGRTPRPDLFDRPYSHDYSGESFRRVFKQSYQPVLNQIQVEQPKEFTKRKFVVAPTSDIFLESESSHGAKPIHEQASNIIQEIQKTYEDTQTTTTVDPIIVASNEVPSSTERSFPTSTRAPVPIVPPSKYYSPPFLEPIYNLEYTGNADEASNESKLDRRQSTNNKHDFRAFDSVLKASRNASREDYDFSKYIVNRNPTTRSPPKKVPSVSSTFRNRVTTQRPALAIQDPTPFRLASNPAPFSAQARTTTRAPPTTRFTTRPTTTTRRPTTRPTVRLILPSSTTLPPTIVTDKAPQAFSKPISVSSNEIQVPSQQLLPPFEDFKHHDEVTLGPPIYYEWKAQMPSLDILPPFLDSELKDDTLTAHSQTTRSISATGLPQNSLEGALKELMKTNYDALKEKFSIPTFDFPLESAEGGRMGYEEPEATNSFQLKIPRDVSKIEWYGENGACPECHPAFLTPGTCEPCVRIKN